MIQDSYYGMLKGTLICSLSNGAIYSDLERSMTKISVTSLLDAECLRNGMRQSLVVLLKLIIRQFWLNIRLVSPVIFHAGIHRLMLN